MASKGSFIPLLFRSTRTSRQDWVDSLVPFSKVRRCFLPWSSTPMTTSTQSFSVIPSDLLVDAVGVNVGEGISREVPLLPLVELGLPLDFEGGDDIWGQLLRPFTEDNL